jgi:hypothetical protein
MTERGTRIETLDFLGHSTPWRLGDWVHLHLVVTGMGQPPVHCEPMQIQKAAYDESFYTLSESEFWEDVGAQALMQQQALEQYRADPNRWSDRAVQSSQGG